MGAAREVLSKRPGATAEEAEQSVRLRVARQGILAGPKPPMYSTLMDESVLHRPVGGPEVMREQLQKILDLLNPPCITVRVIPLEAGLTVGCLGAFEVATMRDGGSDHACLESAEEGRITNRAATVQALIVRWEALTSMADPVDRSRRTMGEVNGDLWMTVCGSRRGRRATTAVAVSR